MNIAKYTFISPYPSPIQVGHLDPSSVEDSSSKSGAETESLIKASNQTLQKAEVVKEEISTEAKPVVSQNSVLDVYA